MTGSLTIQVSKDMMTAVALVGKEGTLELTPENIKKTIEEAGIKTGIDNNAIETIAKGEAFNSEIIVARGKAAVPGSDAHYEFKFDTGKKEYHPSVLEDGSVDYSFQRQLVKEGDVVAVYVPPKAGFFGFTVFADVVAPVPSKGCRKLEFNGVEMYDEEVVATKDGEVLLNGDTLSVVDYLTIPGNASNVMGDIVYKGDIHIKGDVLAGTNIISTGNVYIDGDVEAATIDAGKDVVVKRGIHGQQRAIIKAGGSLCAYFIEEATVIAGEQVRFNYSYNSHIFSMKDVIAEGRHGSIIGGDVEARETISINTAGNDAEAQTSLKIEATNGSIRQKCMIEIKKHAYPGTEILFADNGIDPKPTEGEYHLIHGVVKFFERGTFEEEVIPVASTADRKKTILLVDDEPIILKTFFTYLKNDYNVLAVSSAKDAFKVLDKTLPDLMLLDYNMPVMDGGQMLEQVRKTTWRTYHDVPVIFASAVADKDVVRKCLSLYPQGYLVKPLSEYDLKEVLKGFFEKKE